MGVSRRLLKMIRFEIKDLGLGIWDLGFGIWDFGPFDAVSRSQGLFPALILMGLLGYQGIIPAFDKLLQVGGGEDQDSDSQGSHHEDR